MSETDLILNFANPDAKADAPANTSIRAGRRSIRDVGFAFFARDLSE